MSDFPSGPPWSSVSSRERGCVGHACRPGEPIAPQPRQDPCSYFGLLYWASAFGEHPQEIGMCFRQAFATWLLAEEGTLPFILAPSPGPSAPGRVWSGRSVALPCERGRELGAAGQGLWGRPSGWGRTQHSGRRLRGESFWHLVQPKHLCRKVPLLWGPEMPRSAIPPSQGPVWAGGPWPHS